MILFILGALLFIGLVLVHEWGHFIASKKNGVEVEEFGLGFPPRAKALGTKNGTLYTLNWLPLGGFVKLKGEHDADTSKGSFGAASLKAKTLIMLAGVGMNLVVAFVLFTIVAWIGMPNVVENQFTVARDTKIVRDYDNKDTVNIGEVVAGSPAERAGLKPDARIVSIAGVAITDPEQLSETTKANAGKSVEVVVTDGSQEQRVEATLNSSSPYLGITSYPGQTGIQLRRSTWSAPIVSAGVMKDFTVATFKGLGTALKGLGSLIAGGVTGNAPARQAGQTAASSQVAGPIGIVETLYQGSKLGAGFMLFIIAIISLTLAIMNVLPIPALDGGRLYTMLIFRAARKKLTQTTEERIQATGFALLMMLFILITIVDVHRFL